MKIALIWASNNPEKYWNKILKDLIFKWYTVYPVNPKESEVEGIKSYKTISDIKENFDAINFVVPPKITLTTLEKDLNLIKSKKIWCQPWASDQKVKVFLENNWFTDYVIDSCIMLETIKKIDNK